MAVVETADEPVTEWLTIETTDGPMRVYRARPARQGAPRAAVVVLQEAFGVNDHIQDVARRVAEHGYLALAPDLFHRSDVEIVDYADRATAMALIEELGPEPIVRDLDAVLVHLDAVESVPVERVGVVGFCFGGRSAFTAATALPGLAATVVFYGPGIAEGPHAVLDRVPGITGPVRFLVGSADPTIPAEHLGAIEAACEQAGIDLRVVVFPGAGHAFHCDARPQAYRAADAKRAWQQTVTFLATQLGGPS